MSTPQVHWGWRIQCAEPGCACYLECWGEQKEGDSPHTPPLPVHGITYPVEHEGWFWQASLFKNKDYYGGTRSYRAYCPDHAVPVFAWMAELSAWKEARYAQGKQVHGRVFPRLQEWGAKLLHRRVGESVEEWVERNPRPTPPWETDQLQASA